MSSTEAQKKAYREYYNKNKQKEKQRYYTYYKEHKEEITQKRKDKYREKFLLKEQLYQLSKEI